MQDLLHSRRPHQLRKDLLLDRIAGNWFAQILDGLVHLRVEIMLGLPNMNLRTAVVGYVGWHLGICSGTAGR
jgi:hypothetical protein